MSDPIVERIEREAGVPGSRRCWRGSRRPICGRCCSRSRGGGSPSSSRADVLRRWEDDRLARPRDADPGAARRARAPRLRAAAAGVRARSSSRRSRRSERARCSAAIPQDWVVATARGGEVVSDSTNVLALECALRRRRDRRAELRLCASHRLLARAAVRAAVPRSTSACSTLVSAGRAGAEDACSTSSSRFYLAAARAFGATVVDREPRKQAYYGGATFGVSVAAASSSRAASVDWTQRLLGDRKERLLVGRDRRSTC